MKIYNKLVRDRIPTIINASGGECEFRVATTEEMSDLLLEKLREEVEELIENPNTEEIAVVLEVLETIAKVKNISLEDIRLVKVNKKRNRGGFKNKIVLLQTN